MSLYQLIFDALVESWILHAGWENRWVGVSAWFSAVGWIPGGHSLDLQLKTVKISSLLNWMENLLLNPKKQIHFKIPAYPKIPLLRSCLPPMGPWNTSRRLSISQEASQFFIDFLSLVSERIVFTINLVLLGGDWAGFCFVQLRMFSLDHLLSILP